MKIKYVSMQNNYRWFCLYYLKNTLSLSCWWSDSLIILESAQHTTTHYKKFATTNFKDIDLFCCHAVFSFITINYVYISCSAINVFVKPVFNTVVKLGLETCQLCLLYKKTQNTLLFNNITHLHSIANSPSFYSQVIFNLQVASNIYWLLFISIFHINSAVSFH